MALITDGLTGERVDQCLNGESSRVEDAQSVRARHALTPEAVEQVIALRPSTTQGRAVLRRVLRGRITCTPRGAGYLRGTAGPLQGR